MEHGILQVVCMIVVLYIALIYMIEKRRLGIKGKTPWFEWLLLIGTVSIFFDGFSAYTVNHLNEISETSNMIAHGGYLLGLDTLIFIMFLYVLHLTDTFPKRLLMAILYYCPFVLSVAITLLYLKDLQYVVGETANYAKGISASACFVTAGVYIIFSTILFVKCWKHIEQRKRASIAMFLVAVFIITLIKFLRTELLITAVAPALFVLGIYVNQENPIFKELDNYQAEMIMGFSTLVGSRDDSTGGHIRRTSCYAEILAEGLLDRGYYRQTLTRDYINNLVLAAPMHDIGKIAIPDEILCKPGELTEEEYEQMKQHTVKGAQLILDTFGHLKNDDYKNLAYSVARYHHERWDGKGYPEGLESYDIPLEARIMAIADVFDALSEERYYRGIIPMAECFRIIETGRGSKFEPLLVEVFLELKPEIEKIYLGIHKDV